MEYADSAIGYDVVKNFSSKDVEYYYMSKPFAQSMHDSHGKIWTRDFSENHVFKESRKVIINHSGVFICQVWKEGTWLSFGATCLRVMNNGLFTDLAINTPDNEWFFKTESRNGRETEDYKKGISFLPMYLDAFLKYAPKETKFLPPKKKIKLFHCKYKNELPFNIGLLDLNYYTESIQSNPFAVRGHWKMQPYGPNRMYRRLKWIDLYWKKSYTKGAYMEKSN